MNHTKWLRNNLSEAQIAIMARGGKFNIDAYAQLDATRKELQTKVEELQSLRNQTSKQIGKLKQAKQPATDLLAKVANINQELTEKSTNLEKVSQQLYSIESNLPNIPHKSTPDGLSEADNVVMETIGSPRNFDFEIKDHVDLGENLQGMNFPKSRAMSGARFCVYTNKVAKLHRVLANWMLDLHTQDHGYTEINPPVLVNKNALFNSGQLPKFEEDLFMCSDIDLGLIPTAEVSLVNYAANKLFTPDELPLKLTAHTPCFRKEAGSYGKDTKGIIRMHQFEKVELVQIVIAENSYEALEEICQQAQKVLKLLDLPYQVVALAKGDLGFCAAKTYDLEVWIPSQNCYREIASISNCESFQARRMQSRVKLATNEIVPVHTLNGSGLAISRTLVAIMENYQNQDGSITMPEILRTRLGFNSISKENFK